IVTAVLLAIQAFRVIQGGEHDVRPRGTTPGTSYAIAGFAAGFVSGLLGVGGGIIMVPILTTILGMPLKRALGTSLVVISAIVVPGTIVHALLGHIDWAIFLVLTVGVVPGARIGATLALRAKDRTLPQDVAVPKPLQGTLPPNGTRTVTISRNLKSLPDAASFLYPMKIDFGSGSRALATLRTPVVYLVEQPKTPLGLGWTFALD